jgi:2-keto-4-pentenoate hydratase/2-oxohepta-3-ene-1,7-dioic acid hydratase in catechol pathway
LSVVRFATLVIEGREQSCVRDGDDWCRLDGADPSLAGDLHKLIAKEPSQHHLTELAAKAKAVNSTSRVAASEATYAPPYRTPPKIWGIGLNYRRHAKDLSENSPTDPASFIKGAQTIIGHNDHIVIPKHSSRTTSEAELGIIFGRHVIDARAENALDGDFGVCAILDQTAEDILRVNPRFLTLSKNFPSFFAFGPEVVTLEEFLNGQRLAEVRVSTLIDSEVVRSDVVAGMTHSPTDLIAFHSQRFPFAPGDILSTGTPGAGVISAGMRVTAQVSGLAPLVCTVAR